MIDVNDLLFHKPDRTYSERTAGYVNIGGTERIAVMQGGLVHAPKAMLYCHGNGEDICECVTAFDTCGFVPSGVLFAAVAYPGYGLSEGEQSEAGCYRNVHRLYEWMRNDGGLAPEDILVVGYSLGTGVALELASTCPVGAVLLQAPFVSGRRLLEYWHPELKDDLPPDVAPFPSIDRICKVTCPIAVIHGEEDGIVPFAQGEELYAAAPEKGGFTAVQSAGHCNLLLKIGPLHYRKIVEALLLQRNA